MGPGSRGAVKFGAPVWGAWWARNPADSARAGAQAWRGGWELGVWAAMAGDVAGGP